MLAATPCPQDPAQPAIGTCARCGRFVCESCVDQREGNPYCGACAQRVAGLFAGSWLSIVAAISSFIGLGCAPFALAALVMAVIDLGIILGAQRHKAGIKLDLIAIALAVLGMIVGALIVQRILSGELDA